MNETGAVERLFIASDAEATMTETDAVEAVAGRGLRGDRYFRGRETGTFVTWKPDERPPGYDLTLIEREAVEAVERDAGISLAPGEHRRNVETRNVALNHLVETRFRLGEVICRGVRLCEPCSHLQRITEDGVLDAFVHRGGLRVDIIEDGTIRAGDEIVVLG